MLRVFFYLLHWGGLSNYWNRLQRWSRANLDPSHNANWNYKNMKRTEKIKHNSTRKKNHLIWWSNGEYLEENKGEESEENEEEEVI